ncbi:F-box/kelch-repeat protein At3g23880-like [Arachis hypogaea]|uniref:F-box/kelch-repeat protein At3g23880-like n=1 Tax=Arachis hypogaea TaxID=3818 RepID=UPI0007AEF592|nr:F-box/kelch-repeat protein At3g23880-like [Arachis hypogaea]
MPTDHNDAASGTELVSCPTARTRQLAELSEDMIMEILLRLPARTLVSLRSVCKSWRNLISSPDFTRNHLRSSCLRDPSLTPLRIVCYNSWPFSSTGVRYDGIGVVSLQSIMDNPSEATKVDYFRGQHNYRIVGSCHGLLCFFDDHDNQNTHGILWNPCTGFTFQSPQLSGGTFPSGFGYDHLSDSYKLFGIIRKKGPSGVEYSTRIYTFGSTSSWRRIDDSPFGLLGIRTSSHFCMAENGVFFGSSRACTINWIVNHHVVLYFDLGKETYAHFTLPDTDSSDYLLILCKKLCVLRNCLSVCYGYLRTQHAIVWQMKEYGDAQSWTKLAMISFRGLVSPLQPFYLSETDVLLAVFSSFKIVLCNLNAGSLDFPVIDEEKNHYLSQSVGPWMAYIYRESLVSPNGLQSNSSKMLLRFFKPKPTVS